MFQGMSSSEAEERHGQRMRKARIDARFHLFGQELRVTNREQQATHASQEKKPFQITIDKLL